MSLSFLLFVSIPLLLLIYLTWRISRDNTYSGDSGSCDSSYSGSWGSDTSSCDSDGSCDGGGGGD